MGISRCFDENTLAAVVTRSHSVPCVPGPGSRYGGPGKERGRPSSCGRGDPRRMHEVASPGIFRLPLPRLLQLGARWLCEAGLGREGGVEGIHGLLVEGDGAQINRGHGGS